jgi:activator of HSP90 ATPase
MPESIKVSAVLPASPKRLYEAWLDSKEHSKFTGGKAVIDGRKGGNFTAWDGYIRGKNLELEPNKRIVQSWRTSEFPSRSADSRIEVLFDKAESGAKITIVHTSIPEGQGEEYRQGWLDYYFKPMKEYFGKKK